MTGSDRPALNFFPYLPLRRAEALGPYLLVPTNEFSGPWLDDQFEGVAREFLAAFVGTNGQPLKAGAILVDPVAGCDGALPTAEDRLAIQRAVELAALDANPTWTPDAQGWNAITSDNAEMHSWPIDVEGRAVTLTSGFVAHTMHGGLRIADGFVVPAPEELHMPLVAITLDPDVLDAAYRHFLPSTDPDDERERRRLRESVGWLSKAWRNTPSVDWWDRIVLLKTGFEALTGHSTTHVAATSLRELFERVVGTEEHAGRDLLWSGTETATRIYVDRQGTPRDCTDLEHWFRSFGDARNSIIHGDVTPESSTYTEQGSAYVGPYFHTAERLLRESIKVALAERGEPLLYESTTLRRMTAHLESLLAGEGE